MELHVDGITINLIKNDVKSTEADDLRQLVDYVDVLFEIYNDTKLHEASWSSSNKDLVSIKLDQESS